MMMNRHAAALTRLVAGLTLIVLGLCGAVPPAAAQDKPLEVTVSGAQFEPIPIAIARFEAEGPALGATAASIAEVLENDLAGSGLFKAINRSAFLETPAFDAVPRYADWRTVNAEALVTGRVLQTSDGRLQVQFRLFDTTAETQLHGEQFLASPDDWRRVAHKVADAVYTRLTGEGPYFDSRVVFVDETGPKGSKRKRLAIMDQDGANVRYLPGASGLVLTPRFSPNDQSLLYISYDSGTPQVFLLNLDTGQRERLGNFPGMSFAPRFSPNGQAVALSLSEDGNTDVYRMALADRRLQRLTSNPAIDTAASFSPDGAQIVFESDRGGSQQLYVMPAAGGEARRISFGQGNYGTPVWSPKGDLIAFTKILGGRFHIGVMRPDGSAERLLSTSFLDEGPTFSPNGRVLMFFRQTPGQSGQSQLMSIDVTGRNLKVVDTPNSASDPAWSPLRR